MEKIVYFQCNDWEPYPSVARHFIYDYLEGRRFSEDNRDAILKTHDEVEKYFVINEVCVACDLYDMSIQYWITCKKGWLEKNFPELLPFAKEEPEDDFFDGDRKFFLKYCPENYGLRCIHTDEPEDYENSKEIFVEFKENLI